MSVFTEAEIDYLNGQLLGRLAIRGRAEAVSEGGAAPRPGFDDAMIRIHPERIVSFGLRPGRQSSEARSV